MSQKKEYEVALVGAFRREKDKDIIIQTLVAENQTAMQLVKQREDEIQSLKLRLRFREAGIKRLEAVASGKISAETHLLQEKDEHLKEIGVLRSQVDRNKEATRFAMENLRLKEEIRRLKSFCEEGERERMNEQITMLQNKLLEALDCKLMHESDPSVQNGHTEKKILSGDDIQLLSGQAIQNQSELDSLRKKLDLCVEEKEKLQRYVNDLEMQMEAEKSSKAAATQENLEEKIELPSLINNQMPYIAATDQMELKTMVDAIAAASQREAKAHETAIFLSKENDELKMKLKVLIEDNNKLIEFYEQAFTEKNTDCRNNQTGEELQTKEGKNQYNQDAAEENLVTKAEVENLKNQLVEMHDENEKLMGQYEKAMQERDEFKRLFANEQENIEIRREFNCPEKLVEIDEGENPKCDEACPSVDEKSRALEAAHTEKRINPQLEQCAAEDLVEEAELYDVNVQDWYTQYSVIKTEGSESEKPSHFQEDEVREVSKLSSDGLKKSEASHLPELCIISSSKGHEELNTCNGNPESGKELEINARPSDLTTENFSEDTEMVRKKLVEEAQEKLSSSALMVGTFGSLERALLEFDELSEEIEKLENSLHLKHKEYESSKLHYAQMHDRKVLLDRKLAALKYSLSSFTASISYFEQREARVSASLDASAALLNQKKDELVHLHVQKDEIVEAKMKVKQAELELKTNMSDLKSKMEEETRRLENERVLFAIDNVEEDFHHPMQRNWRQLGVKATDLLKSEEEKTKLQNQMKQNQERLLVIKKEHEDLKKKMGKVENEIHIIQKEIEKQEHSVEEMNQKLQNVITEKQMVLDMKENGRNEFENIFIDYHECVVESVLKEEENRILDEELREEAQRIEDLKREKAMAWSQKSQLFDEISSRQKTCLLVSDKIKEDLQSISMTLADLASVDDNVQKR